MSSFEYTSAPRTVSVLPASATRRLTRRDGLLPLVLALELLAGIAFGLAAHSGSSDATSVPAKLTLGPSTVRPVASVRAIAPAVVPSVGPVSPAAEAPAGPAVGPLLPGTVRAPQPEGVDPLAAAVVKAPSAAAPPHDPRDPFAPLVTVKP